MNQLQSVIDSLPQYHLRSKALADMTLANIGEIVNYFKRKGNDALANQFYAYMRGMELNLGEEWKHRSNGFTMGASHHLKQRYADSMRMYYGISLEG